MTRWQQFKRKITAIVFPERCIFCGEVIPPLTLCCDTCRAKIQVVKQPRCPYCGVEKKQCRCQQKRHHYDRIVAPLYCEKSVHKGILRLKRYDDPIAIDFFADQMAAVVLQEFGTISIDTITFIPISAKDAFRRGYNQGERLAYALGKRLKIPVERLLVKLYETKPQKSLPALFRSGNVFGVFDVQTDTPLTAKTVLLVDDVLTTGATLNECAKLLKLYGAEKVFAVTASVRRPKQEKDL